MTLEKNEILFAKLREDAIIPSKREEDAGFDIYANFDAPYMIIYPHETKMIPTGLACAFDRSYVLVLKERGSTGTKGLGQRCGVIDSGFRGEIFVPLTNHNDAPVVIAKSDLRDLRIVSSRIIYPYTKAICQAILLPLPAVRAREVTVDELLAIPSERGAGVTGSSGK